MFYSNHHNVMPLELETLRTHSYKSSAPHESSNSSVVGVFDQLQKVLGSIPGGYQIFSVSHS